MNMPVRILVADDHTIVRSGVKMLLSAQPDFQVIGEAGDGEEAVRMALELDPEIVVMDLSMPPGKDGISATIELKRSLPDTKVLILTMHEEEEYLFRVLQAGASGYIIKNALDSELVSAIRAIYRGEVYLHPSVAKQLVQEFLKRPDLEESMGNVYLLTEREREILVWIAKGYANKEIAKKLIISVKTVESHKARIMDKLGLYTRHELVEYALKKGFLSLDMDFPTMQE